MLPTAVLSSLRRQNQPTKTLGPFTAAEETLSHLKTYNKSTHNLIPLWTFQPSSRIPWRDLPLLSLFLTLSRKGFDVVKAVWMETTGEITSLGVAEIMQTRLAVRQRCWSSNQEVSWEDAAEDAGGARPSQRRGTAARWCTILAVRRLALAGISHPCVLGGKMSQQEHCS